MQDTLKVTPKIIKLVGSLPGPTVAIFAGVHGNETVGVLALQELVPKLKLTRGTLYVAFANVPAIVQNVRMVGKNLNRCFFAGNVGDSYEDIRARELMSILDDCDALLDLHAFGKDDPEEPFIICEDNALDLATKLNPKIISTNWTETEPGGTDGYMYKSGKISICIECGPLARPEDFKSLALTSVDQFLKYFDMVKSDVVYSTGTKKIIRVQEAVIRDEENFKLDSDLYSFQYFNKDRVIGSMGDKKLTVQAGDYIIFPRPNVKLGGEAYLLGRELKLS